MEKHIDPECIKKRHELEHEMEKFMGTLLQLSDDDLTKPNKLNIYRKCLTDRKTNDNKKCDKNYLEPSYSKSIDGIEERYKEKLKTLQINIIPVYTDSERVKKRHIHPHQKKIQSIPHFSTGWKKRGDDL